MPWIEQLGVELVLWPDDDRLRTSLARAGVPRLLVISSSCEPPDDVGIDEDVVRLPVSDTTLQARAAALVRAVHDLRHVEPLIDVDGTLHRGSTTRTLGPREAAALGVLIEQSGALVTREHLSTVAWPHTTPSPDAIDALIGRLRHKLQGTGLRIRTSRRHGFVLHSTT